MRKFGAVDGLAFGFVFGVGLGATITRPTLIVPIGAIAALILMFLMFKSLPRIE